VGAIEKKDGSKGDHTPGQGVLSQSKGEKEGNKKDQTKESTRERG